MSLKFLQHYSCESRGALDPPLSSTWMPAHHAVATHCLWQWYHESIGDDRCNERTTINHDIDRERKERGRWKGYICVRSNKYYGEKGDTITIHNQSGELQDVDQGDAQKAGVDVKIPVNESATPTFHDVGTFKLQSEKGAAITGTVN
jgi:hypothetical protein